MTTPKATLRILGYSVSPETFRCVLREFNAWPGLDVDIVEGMANIDRGRSMIATSFLERPLEDTGPLLLMVDSDMAWRLGDLAYIAEAAIALKAVVGGVYPKRMWNQGLAIRVAHAGEHTMGTDRFVACDYVGTGFIAIPRFILERLAETLPLCVGGLQPFFMPFVREKDGRLEYPTDDAAFCARVKEAGCSVYAALNTAITHVGSYGYRVQDGYTSPPETKEMVVSFQGAIDETPHT